MIEAVIFKQFVLLYQKMPFLSHPKLNTFQNESFSRVAENPNQVKIDYFPNYFTTDFVIL